MAKQPVKTATVAREERAPEIAPVVEAGFWERFSWRDFFCYGALWCVIFFALVCLCRIGGIIAEQKRQINDLIDRLNQYEEYTPSPPFDRDEGDKADDLTAWVKKNLPSKGIEERPAVAEVFSNLAEMLEAGTLTGEKDTFSEGIAQLQPVATRSVWLPFLTKLTKRLKSAKLDSAGLAAACRTVSRAIFLPTKKQGGASSTDVPCLLLEGASGIANAEKAAESTPDAQEADVDKLPKEDANPSLIAPEEPKSAENQDKPERTPDTAQKSCPTGNCPAQNQNINYGGYQWRYF